VFIGVDVGGGGIAYGRTETFKEGFVHYPHRPVHRAPCLDPQATVQAIGDPRSLRDPESPQSARRISFDSPA
jgi:hypothetical protein